MSKGRQCTIYYPGCFSLTAIGVPPLGAEDLFAQLSEFDSVLVEPDMRAEFK